MSLIYFLSCIASLGLLIYLIVALLKPELF